ncbi:MAG: RIP metalloprotease RseP [Lautropia sp.]|nr:RIP metalloprotease RseP [Lautropia sp.]
MTTLIAFLFALGVLVFVHELGHYLVARWCGVKVLRFSIGFGKPLFTWKVGPDQTEWSLSPIPLGGYVRMLDEEDEQCQVDPAEAHRAFNRLPLLKRSAVVVAGPLANFLLAIVLYAVLGMAGLQEPAPVLGTPPGGTAAAVAGVSDGDRVSHIDGQPVQSFNDLRLKMIDAVVERRPIVLQVNGPAGSRQLSIETTGLPPGEVEPGFARTLGIELKAGVVRVARVEAGSASAQAGLKEGDDVLAVDGKPLARASQLIEQVQAANDGQVLTLLVRRDGAEMEVPVTPALSYEQDQADSDAPPLRKGRIGAALHQHFEMVSIDLGPVEALAHGAARTWEMSIFSLKMLGKMITGNLSWKNLSGPVAIADYAGQSAAIGWYAYVGFMALISVSLGVLNLLPVPVLDGGRLVYYAAEAIKGSPFSDRFRQASQQVGLVMIVGLMIVALFNDLSRLFG